MWTFIPVRRVRRPAVLARSADGRTPTEVAALNGCPEMVEWLVGRGAAPPALEGVDGLIGAALTGDRGTVERLRAHVEAARAERPALIVWAAARGQENAIPLLVDLGFDVNALGRTDVPMEQAWETALHAAASRGDVALARALSTSAPIQPSRMRDSNPPHSVGPATSVSNQ